MNLAGRLSSAAKRPVEEDEAAAGPAVPANGGLSVRVDAEGRLFNEGIALSRDTLGQLESELALVHGETGLEYDDAVIGRTHPRALRGRREVQGRALEPARLRGGLRGAGLTWSASSRPGGWPT